MPKIVDHEKYREELILKCFDLFSRKGYSKVTMREIAKEVNVSTGTLYHYFPTKLNIFEQMFNQVAKHDVNLAMLQINKAKTLKDKLNNFAYFLEDKKEYYQSLLLLAIDFYRTNDTNITNKIIKSFSEYVSKTMTNTLEVPDKFGTVLVFWLIGLIYHSLLTPNTIIIKDEIKRLEEMLE